MKKCIWLILCIFIATGISSAALALNRIDYRQQEECSLCGNESDSILALYSDTNGVGLLNFNNFTVNALRICNEEPDMPMSGSSHTTNTSGENGSIISIDSNLNRRIAEVTISFREKSKPNLKKMAQFLCSDCCKRIKQENEYDVAFIDYQTKKIFPIKENMIEFYIGDYAIHKLNAGDNLEYLVFFAPEQ